MAPDLLLALSALAATAVAIPTTSQPTHKYGTCEPVDIPITASVPGNLFDLPLVDSNIEAMHWAILQDTWSTPLGPLAVTTNITIEGTWNIHGMICYPDSWAEGTKVLQIATHGIHYDSRYWDPRMQPQKHSYVEAALKEGFAIFTYDRLGVGQSDHPDAYRVVQANLEVDVLRQLTVMIKDGTICSGSNDKPKKIVHIGHSFGTVITGAFVSTYPDLSDAAVLTCFLPNKYAGMVSTSSWAPQFAPTAELPFDRPVGYAVAQKSGIQAVFFGGDPKTAYTPAFLDYGNSLKQPFPVAETASAYTVLVNPGAADFKGPVQYVVAEFDFFICKGDCKGAYNETELTGMWAGSEGVEFHLQPNSGHGLPFHNNATAGFEATFGFLERYGLGAAAS